MTAEQTVTTVRPDEVQGFVERQVRDAANRAEKAWRKVDPQKTPWLGTASQRTPEQMLADGLRDTEVFIVGARIVGARFPGNDAAIEMIAGDITCAMTNAAEEIKELENWEVKREGPDYLTLTWQNSEE